MGKLSVLHVGCGSISDAWFSHIVNRDDSKYVGLVDLNMDAAKKKAEKYQLSCGLYDDLDIALEKTHPDIVIDNTTPQAHVHVTTRALEAGSHVFGEKPLADTRENAKKMVETAKRTGKRYIVMQNRRYTPYMCAFEQIIQKEIGTLGFLTAQFFLGPRFGGFRDAMEDPLILDMAIHTFDQARMLIGKEPLSVYCHSFNPKGSWYKGDANASCIFEFEDNIIFSYNGSWCANGLETSWESEWRAQGSEGMALWDGSSAPVYSVMMSNEDPYEKKPRFFTKTTKLPRLDFEGHAGCIHAMFEAIKNNCAVPTECHTNYASLMMVFDAIKSARTGQKVQICTNPDENI